MIRGALLCLVLAGPAPIQEPEQLTRAAMPATGDTGGEHFILSISGTSAASGSAMTKGELYRIGCTVDTICEFAAAAPTADPSSTYFVPADGFDYFLVGSPGNTDNDWVACIAQDGSSTGSCYFHNTK